MRIHWLTSALVAVAASVYGQTVQDGGTTNLFPNATLTNVYTASSSIGLKSYDSVAYTIKIGSAQASGVAKIKSQWSADNSNWYNEMVLDSGTSSSGETQFNPTPKVLIIPMSTGTNTFYIERSRRLARYFRFSVASTNTFTTGTLQIEAKPANNNN